MWIGVKKATPKATPKAGSLWESDKNGSAALLEDILRSRCTLGTASSMARKAVGQKPKNGAEFAGLSLKDITHGSRLFPIWRR